MKVRFRMFCPPYVRGDVAEVSGREAIDLISRGIAEDAAPPQEEVPVKTEAPAKPKRGRAKRAAKPKARSGE